MAGFGAVLRLFSTHFVYSGGSGTEAFGLAAGLRGDGHPVLEVLLLDSGPVDLGDGVAGDAAASGGHGSGCGEGAERQEKSSSLDHERAFGRGDDYWDSRALTAQQAGLEPSSGGAW